METINLKTIRKGLKHPNHDIAIVTAKSCKNRNIPISTILDWSSSISWYVRAAALYACVGRSEPELRAIIEKALEDEVEENRLLAQKILAQSPTNN